MNNREKMIKLFILSGIFIYSILSGSIIYSQVSEFDSIYNIYSRTAEDSVRFNIYGDKKPQVEISIISLDPLPLPERIKPPQDVIVDYGLMEKVISFKPINGTKYFGNASAGSHTYFDAGGTVIYGGKEKGFTVDVKNRIAKENTPQNLSPSIQEMSFRGNMETASGNYVIDLDMAGHNDNISGSGFHPGKRKAGLFTAGGYVKDIKVRKWKLGGGLNLTGGSFDGLGFRKSGNEFGLKGNFNTFGDFDVFYLGMYSSIEKYGIAGNNGSILSAGFKSGWLLFNRISIKPGGDFFIFDVPGKPARGKFYPNIGIDGTITELIRLKMNIAPSIKTYTFRDSYQRNGLLNTPIPIAVEDRKNEVNGELGINLPSGADFSLGGYYARTGDFPVFSRSGDYFSLSTVKDITLYGLAMKIDYKSGDNWETKGSIKFNNSKWDYAGKVPYIPSGEGTLNFFYRMNRFWKIISTLNYFGEHYVEINSKETQKSFTTLDIGMERKLLNDSASFSIEIRNITNSKGAWWTEQYKSPGTGIYSGFKIIK